MMPDLQHIRVQCLCAILGHHRVLHFYLGIPRKQDAPFSITQPHYQRVIILCCRAGFLRRNLRQCLARRSHVQPKLCTNGITSAVPRPVAMRLNTWSAGSGRSATDAATTPSATHQPSDKAPAGTSWSRNIKANARHKAAAIPRIVAIRNSREFMCGAMCDCRPSTMPPPNAAASATAGIFYELLRNLTSVSMWNVCGNKSNKSTLSIS